MLELLLLLFPMLILGNQLKEMNSAVDQLLMEYPAKNSRFFPIEKKSELPMIIEMQMQLLNFEGIDDLREEMAFVGSVLMQWHDPLLYRPNITGNESEFYFTVNSQDIWTPNLANTNNPNDLFTLKSFGAQNMPWIYPNQNGLVSWYPSGRFATKCPLDLTFFPFDEQLCTFRFISWDWDTTNLVIKVPSQKPSLFTMNGGISLEGITSDLWTIKNGTVQIGVNAYGSTNYSSIDFTLTIERRPMYYLYTVIIPLSLLSFLQIIGLVHPHGEARPNFFMVLVLTFWVIQQGKKNKQIHSKTNLFFFTFL